MKKIFQFLKRILAYAIVIPAAMRANFLTAYRETRATGKFTYKVKPPEFFKEKLAACDDANSKAILQGIRWYVIEPKPGNYVAVSQKYIDQNPQYKPVYQTL